jgi:hypothetical protein
LSLLSHFVYGETNCLFVKTKIHVVVVVVVVAAAAV